MISVAHNFLKHPNFTVVDIMITKHSIVLISLKRFDGTYEFISENFNIITGMPVHRANDK